MSLLLDPEFWARLASIVIIDLSLAGDNALVIALAVRSLAPREQWLGRVWGTAAAVGLRLLFIAVVSALLAIPLLQAVGGLLLLWIAIRLVRPGGGGEGHVRHGTSLREAVWIIVVADVTMSLDNVLAVAAAAHGDLLLVSLGIGLSLPIVVWGSGFLARLMTRQAWIIWIGGGILGYVAGEMITDDPLVRAWLGSHADTVDDFVSVLLAAGLTLLGWWLARIAASRPPVRRRDRVSERAPRPSAGARPLDRVDLEPVKSTRIYEEIVRQVKQLIAEGRLKSGDRLPPERDLAEKFMVSRTSVREALRALQSRGLIDIRAGEGAFVRDVSVETLIEPLALVILPHREAVGELFEARRLLEPAIAALAARRATREEISEMERILEDQAKEVAAGHTGMLQDTALHAAIANSAHNRAITRIVNALMDLLTQSREESLHMPGRPTRSHQDHRRILAAVQRRDEVAAHRAMLDHLIAVETLVTGVQGEDHPAGVKRKPRA